MNLLFSIILTMLITITCILIIYIKYALTYWKRKNVPYVEPTFCFGNISDLILHRKCLGDNILSLYKKLKIPGRKFAGIYFFTKPELLLLDPELVKTIMVKDFQYFSDRGLQYDEKNDPLTGHLVSLRGLKWRNLRQKLTPTFTSGKMKMMFQTIVECSDSLEDILDDFALINEAVDIKEIFGRFTTDIISSCAFGLECNSLKYPDVEFRKYGKKAMASSPILWLKRILSLIFPKIYKMLGFKKIDPEVNDFFMNMVYKTVKFRERNDIQRNDFLQLLINIKNSGDVDNKKCDKFEPGKCLTMNEIAAQCFLFFIAGFETSATTSAFLLYNVAVNQDIQDKVRVEINDMLKKYNNKLTYEGIMELEYLDKVINETLRMFPPMPVLHRRCTQKYKIPESNVTIEEGTMVMIPVMGFQSDPEYYPEPEKFDPERFSSDVKEKRHPFTFLPFGEGPRNCIGIRFGLLQTKIGLVTLLKHHKFTLNSRTKIPFQMSPRNIIYSVEGGIWLNVERIKRPVFIIYN